MVFKQRRRDGGLIKESFDKQNILVLLFETPEPSKLININEGISLEYEHFFAAINWLNDW